MFIIVMVFGNFSEFNNQVLVKIILKSFKVLSTVVEDFQRPNVWASRRNVWVMAVCRIHRRWDIGDNTMVGQQPSLWMRSHLVGTEDVEGYRKPEGGFHWV